MNKIFIIILFLPVMVLADVAPNKKHEVAYLLDYIVRSGCVLTRNGTQYKGKDAAEHIQTKYDYYRRDINNTEDFIKYAATKSTMSGKYYTVKCNGQKESKTKDWLLRELEVYRMKRRF